MNDRRFRLYISIIFGVFVFSFIRIIANTNPIYDIGEPVFTWLDTVSREIALTRAPVGTPEERVLVANEKLRIENQALRQELGLEPTVPTLTAEVARRDLLGFEKNVWVTLGDGTPVRLGQTVLAGGQLYGVVDAVFDNSARIQTILDPDFRTTVQVGDEQGVIRVDHGSLLLDLIPSRELAGRAVLTNGLDGRIITNVPVGRADGLISSPADVFGTYNILLPYSIYEVSVVEIVLSESEL